MSDARKFIVWNVYGYSGGNVRLLAVYHYRDRNAADKHASRVRAGHVIRSHQEREPHATETHAEGDSLGITLSTAETSVEDMKRQIVAATPVDTLPPVVRTRSHGWTG